MNNYLDNIIGRSLNAVEVIQPRLPLLFEPVAQDMPSASTSSRSEIVSSDEDELIEKTSSRRPPTLRAAAGQIASFVSETPTVKTLEPTPHSQSDTAEPMQVLSSRQPQAEGPIRKQQPVETNEPENVQTTRRPNNSVIEKVSHEKFGLTEQPIRQVVPAATSVSTTGRPSQHFRHVNVGMQLVEPSLHSSTTSESGGLSSVRVRSNGFSRENSQPPTIKITIGRVDVRALMPAPAQANPPPVKPKPGLSLNDYLKQREEGKR